MYTGDLIESLTASVERAEKAAFDPMDGVLLRFRQEPLSFFKDACNSLADQTVPDCACEHCGPSAICPKCEWNIRYYVRGWHLLRDVHDCWDKGLTEVCVRTGCQQMEGMHIPGLYGCFRFISAEQTFQQVLRNSEYWGNRQDLTAGLDMVGEPEN